MSNEADKLKWFTTDKPLADGWYWCRLKDKEYARLINEHPYVVWADEGEFWDGDYAESWLSSFKDHEFAGPIPEPDDSVEDS